MSETLIKWRDPNKEIPPFNKSVLVALGSWRDEGRGFRAHTSIRTLKISLMDTDGDDEEGALMRSDLVTGVQKWDDVQFTMIDDDGGTHGSE